MGGRGKSAAAGLGCGPAARLLLELYTLCRGHRKQALQRCDVEQAVAVARLIAAVLGLVAVGKAGAEIVAVAPEGNLDA